MKKTRMRIGAWMLSAAMVLSVGTTASAANPKEVIPIGRAAGIRMTADGVIVIKTVPVQNAKGKTEPAADAGLQAGDVILQVDGQSVDSNAALQKKISLSGGKQMTFLVKRGDAQYKLKAAASPRDDGGYQMGLIVRDSIAGIGTITYVDPETGAYGSLGHGICDADTGVLVPLQQGSLMEASVSEVKKGKVGEPGALQGDFDLQHDMGTIKGNTDAGIFGTLTDNRYYANGKTIPIASAKEIHTGQAEILANVTGREVKTYKCEITKLSPTEAGNDGSMVLKITDPELIQRTGGIVQGMSGSPIIQNGKLVGAVTHVLVNDPTKGYGIFIENMLNAAA